MAAQEIIANLAAQVRRLMAEHAKLRGLCDRMKTEGDALRKENRTLQERVRSLEEELSCVRLAEGLAGIGLIKGSAADAVAAGAMTMFMPHGLGHGLGMDVHDCEAMGERSFDFSSIAQRAAKSATCIYRAAWRLEPGTVMTDEPGLYFIPALIDKCRAKGLYKGIVDYDALEGYRDFGGIRIEDDILVTESGSRMLGDKKIPVTVEELEAVVGR